jgi:hypothetical protein
LGGFDGCSVKLAIIKNNFFLPTPAKIIQSHLIDKPLVFLNKDIAAMGLSTKKFFCYFSNGYPFQVLATKPWHKASVVGFPCPSGQAGIPILHLSRFFSGTIYQYIFIEQNKTAPCVLCVTSAKCCFL